MFIPMLIILKLFKLKLLLFLPFILGITGLKKILGLAALVVPGKTEISLRSLFDEGCELKRKMIFHSLTE